ncbi:IS1 family transposase [Ekhidna sp.]|uniref:IS1 family transposase n=1 Tax=Ekhidna sp. TaxID=2608089 RepID=UPI003299219F
MKCRFCTSSCIKKGIRNGIQQYWCPACGKYQREEYKYKSYKISNTLVIASVKEGLGIRSTSRLLGISTTTVLRRIRIIAHEIRKPPISLRKSYEVDELYTFVRSKQKGVWIVLAFERETNRVVDFYIGPRTQRSLRMVVNTLLASSVKTIHTDGLLHYKGLINKRMHRLERYGTNKIERFNLNLRTHLKRLSRRTIAYSKNMDMLYSCLTIYLWG